MYYILENFINGTYAYKRKIEWHLFLVLPFGEFYQILTLALTSTYVQFEMILKYFVLLFKFYVVIYF